MGGPDLPTLVWRDWQTAWAPALAAVAALALYLGAAARVRSWSWWRSLSFAGGVVVVLVALQSGIAAYDDQLLSDHMVQHLLLLELAPLLLLAGRPGILLLRATPRERRPALARRLMSLRPLTHPLVCLVLFTVVVLVSHLASFYDATLRSPALHELEHGLYLSAGLLMWWPLLDGDPVPGHRLSGLGRLVYVIAAMVPMTLVGAYLDRHASLVYAPYAAAGRVLGVSPLLDQQRAGVIMWVLGTVIMVAAGLWQAMAAMSAEERRMQVAERAASVGLAERRTRG